MICYRDRLLPAEEVDISFLDRGYCFGDGVYEVFRIYNGKMYERDLHLARLQRSAAEIKMNLPYPIKRIEELIDRLLEAEELEEGTLYMQITRGIAQRTHAFPPADTEPVLLAYCNEVKRPFKGIEEGIKAVTVPDIRWHRCDIKSLNLLPNILAKQEALERQADEAVFHRDGTITECSASNIMIVKDGVILTHPANHLILHGVTRAVTLRLAEQYGIPLAERSFSLEELRGADEIFITGTTVEITPVMRMDGEPVADGTPGPVTRKLKEAFEATIPK